MRKLLFATRFVTYTPKTPFVDHQTVPPSAFVPAGGPLSRGLAT
jgi:hypothetical protein